MDKNSVDIQYIICECGDNFPNEKLLNFHLANDHANVDTFQCEYCPEIFPTAQLYKHHIKRHNVQKPENKPSQQPKLYPKIDTSPENVVMKPKSPPVIKLENLKKIDDISLTECPVSDQLQVAPEIAAEEIAETDALPSETEEDAERYYKCNVQSQEEPLESTESQDDSIEADQGTEPIDEAITEPMKPEEPKVSPKALKEVTYFKCDLCKILYPSKKAYDSHCNKKHSGAQFGFQFIEQDLEGPILPPPPKQAEIHCEFCIRTFVSKRSYCVHYRRAHCPQRVKSGVKAVASRKYECEACGKKCFSNAALIYHRMTHTGEKPYECGDCHKRFRGYEHLRIHMRTHTGERPFQCPRCPKRFMRKTALIRHDLVHTGVKPYACPHCGKCFAQSNGMKLHVNTVHLKLPGPFRHPRKRNVKNME